MGRLRRFIELPQRDRVLLARALGMLLLVRLALWLLPWRFVRARFLHCSAAPTDRPVDGAAHRIVRAVAVARRYVPRATCLVQAVAAHALLRREGYPVRIEIGARKQDGRRVRAHAWVVADGRILLGRTAGLSRYASLGSLGGPVERRVDV